MKKKKKAPVLAEIIEPVEGVRYMTLEKYAAANKAAVRTVYHWRSRYPALRFYRLLKNGYASSQVFVERGVVVPAELRKRGRRWPKK